MDTPETFLAEYRVKKVERYIVVRYSEVASEVRPGERVCRSELKGEYDNVTLAYEVGYALCQDEHGRLGFPLGDPRIQYPDRSAFDLVSPAK